MKIDINMLSDEYRVHKLTEEDIEDVFNLCIQNNFVKIKETSSTAADVVILAEREL